MFLGLPGNPVAVFTTFLLYCQPMLARLGGEAWRAPQRYPVPAGFRFEARSTAGGSSGAAGSTSTRAVPVLRKFGRDGSGLISGLTKATGFIEVGEDVSRVEEGDVLAFIPFSEFGIAP